MGIETTFRALADNGSTAAIQALVEALSEPYAEIQDAAVALLLSREVRRGLAQVIERFHTFDTKTQARVEKEIGLLMPILREALGAGPGQSRINSLDIVARSREVAHLELAVNALRDASEAVREHATTILVGAAAQLARRTSRPAPDDAGGRDYFDASREKMAAVLADALATYATHGEKRILHALIELGIEGHSFIVNVLLGTNHAAREDFVAVLQNSSSIPAIDLLMQLALERNERAKRLGEDMLSSRRGLIFVRAVSDWLLSLDERELDARASRYARILWLPAVLEHIWELEPRHHSHILRFIEQSRMQPAEKAAGAAGLIGSPAPDVRVRVMRVLAQMGSVPPGEVVARALADPEETVVSAAVDLIVSMNLPDKARLLTPLLSSTFELVRRRVSLELSRDNFERYIHSFDKLDSRTRELAGKAIAKIDPEMAERLADELQSLDPERRVKALRIAETVSKEKELEPILIELLNDPSRKVRATVVRTIGLLGSLDAIRALIKALSDPDRRTRANTIEAFEDIGNPKLAAILMPFLADLDNRIRANAVKALWNLGHPEAKQVLDEMLVDSEELMRLSAVWTMGEIEYPGATQALEKVMAQDSSATVRQKAKDVLKKLAAEGARG
ncbi:MAG: HEAT repeat domain-containing protein [Planctomycetota bacterium]|nr:HEAT repeat domain-containing protein [Planctomycetota bacterium]